MALIKKVYDIKKYDVWESRNMIAIFKKTFWFKNLKWMASYNKEFYDYEETTLYIIINSKEVKD